MLVTVVADITYIYRIYEYKFYFTFSEHIHILSQEALDHADLTVLTATIGASALIKNSLWVYLRSVTINMCPPKGDETGGSLKVNTISINLVVKYLHEM